jgi:hypothetical protein
MDLGSGRRSSHVQRGTLAVAVALLPLLGVVAWHAGQAGHPAPDVRPHMVGAHPGAGFARIVAGMRPADIRALVGPPSQRIESKAEGFAWPEPKDVCWYYPTAYPARGYQVCFIDHEVASHGSFTRAPGATS